MILTLKTFHVSPHTYYYYATFDQTHLASLFCHGLDAGRGTFFVCLFLPQKLSLECSNLILMLEREFLHLLLELSNLIFLLQL